MSIKKLIFSKSILTAPEDNSKSCSEEIFHHSEMVVLLSQRRPDTHIDIKLDLSEFGVTAAETKATYKK